MNVITERTTKGITLEIAGELDDEALAEIARRIAGARRTNERLSVDLSRVATIDRAAILFFAVGAGRGVRIVGPRHVREWIGCEARASRSAA
jgi:anti-anti-sigma regulatory factor